MHAAIPLLQLVAGLVGLGTFAFIAVLHRTIRNLNTQLRSWEERVVTAEREASQANEGKGLAGEAKVGYEALALDRAAQIKELQAQALSLEKSLRLGEDETKREVAALSNRLARLQGKIGSALRATEYAGIATIEQIAGFWSREAQLLPILSFFRLLARLKAGGAVTDICPAHLGSGQLDAQLMRGFRNCLN